MFLANSAISPICYHRERRLEPARTAPRKPDFRRQVKDFRCIQIRIRGTSDGRLRDLCSSVPEIPIGFRIPSKSQDFLKFRKAKLELLLENPFFNPSAPFPPKARGRRGFDNEPSAKKQNEGYTPPACHFRFSNFCQRFQCRTSR